MHEALWEALHHPVRLLRTCTHAMDQHQSALFHHHFDPQTYGLYAIGGYGRGELFPCSDVDLLLLTENPEDERIATWVAALWRLGTEVAPRVCSRAQLEHDAEHDLSLLTSLLDARYLAGQRSALPLRPHSPLWFIEQKLAEQAKRDQRAGKLEPNLKTDVGGLRDLHTMHWLERYCYPEHAPQWFTTSELGRLQESRQALYRLRFALHSIAPHSRDTLYFAEQLTLSKRFYPNEHDAHRAVERFMQDYYRHTYRIRQFNQRYSEQIHQAHLPPRPRTRLSETFYLEHDHLCLAQESDWLAQPTLIWQALALLQANPQWHGLHPHWEHQLYQKREQLITAANRAQHLQGFRTLLQQAGSVHRLLELLHRYGWLHRLIPDFWSTVGRMQYDLFHAYTVDHHSIRLSDYLDQFARVDNPRYPLAHELMQQHPNPAPLYFAALTHDIGKGRTGAHEIVGAELMQDFLAKHQLFTPEEQQHITGLIRHHLLLSVTAQKQDLHDPEVIARFAAQIPNRAFLDDLYLLTLADISATNQQLWNDWKAQLMRQLYQSTVHYWQHQALHAPQPPAPDAYTQALWQNLPEVFFQNESPHSLQRKTEALCHFPAQASHHVLALDERRLLLCSRHPQAEHFSRITQFLEYHHCAILEARLYQSLDQTLTLHEYTLSSLPDPKALCDFLHSNQQLVLRKRRRKIELHYFQPNTVLQLYHSRQRSYLELHCKDQEGLLSRISQVFSQQNIHVIHAKISTFGEKVEDHFTLQNHAHQALSPEQSQALQSALHQALQTPKPR